MRILVSLILTLVFFSSCKDKCKDLDCPEEKLYSFRFKIQDFTSHEDIFYSNNPLYDKNKLKIFAIENEDTVYYSVNQNEVDSTFGVAFKGEKYPLFFKVNENDIDTVKLNFYNLEAYYSPNEPVCCPSDKTITSIYYNETSLNPTVNGAILYKK